MQSTKTLLAAAVALGVSANGAAAQEYHWRMATIDQETGVYFSQIAAPFAEWVEKLTGGRMVIEPLPAGTVGNIFKLHEAVADGLVEMANAPPSFLGTADPVNAMIAGFPTGLGTDSFHAWIYKGGGKELWEQHRHETMDMHPLVLGSGPSEWFAHSHVAIESVDDLEGLKYRTLGNWAAIVKDKFNASPVTIPGSEVYGMLEKQGLDLAEYSMPSENLARGYHEIAKYVVYPGVHAGAWAFEGIMTLDNWNSLPEDIQNAMQAAARIVTHDSFLSIIDNDLEAVAKLEDGGNEFIRLDQEFVENARAAAREWAMEQAEKAKTAGDPWPEKVARSIFDFQDRWIDNSFYLVVDHQD